MSEARFKRVTSSEAARELEYNRKLAERAEEQRRNDRQNAPNTWTMRPTDSLPASGGLIGRVALDSPSPLFDGARDFYIGTRNHRTEKYEVITWTTPVASCTYFRRPPERPEHEDLHASVIGLRVFAHAGGRIADYQDQALVEPAPDDLFPEEELKIPRAPRPREPGQQSPRPAENLAEQRPEEHTPNPPSASLQTSSSGKSTAEEVPGPPLRAGDLLRRQLAAPKSVSMSAVLATLQPDQHQAITLSSKESQILQGHPGTGKTIIATHRAGYLLNPDAPMEHRPEGKVILIGPTDEYVAHIRGALRSLIDRTDTYVVYSLPAFLEDLADLPRSSVPTQTVTYQDASPELARLIDTAHRKAKDRLGRGVRPDRAGVFAELVGLLQDPPPEGLDAEWVSYLRQLPSNYQELRKRRDYVHRGLMAYIGVLVDRAERQIAHVIVDEAQDIHPIEWEVLGRLGNRGGWTILGDLNQRRTDHTFGNWAPVAQLLGIDDEDHGAPVTVLERGYRSTAQIIRYANQLLPRQERSLYSLQQDGEAPDVVRIPSERNLVDSALDKALVLLDRARSGTVAIITVDPAAVARVLTKRGWRGDTVDLALWTQGKRSLRLLVPAHARGLEFDGVVVIEPSAFPENFGRQGVLYTALTRANRYLAVVYHRALPGGLKTRG